MEIADGGKQVYLVERTGTIGGHMAMFDKTFPTLDCAACILTPKMVAVGHHEMIDLVTNAEVESVTGNPGAYKVKVLGTHAGSMRRLCGLRHVLRCLPSQVLSEFDPAGPPQGVYIPFPQAVPNAYLVDEAPAPTCRPTGRSAERARRNAPRTASTWMRTATDAGRGRQHHRRDRVRDSRRRADRAVRLRSHPNVLTSLEFERITNASGPTGGNIVIKTKKLNKRTKVDEWVFDPEGAAPKSVAIIHCVGSRDENYNPYCSRVCCMYSLKFAHLVREKLPEATCYEFYIDMRAFGKGYEEFMERIKAEGTLIIRGRTAIGEVEDGQMIVKGEDILATASWSSRRTWCSSPSGVVPAERSDELAGMLDIPRDRTDGSPKPTTTATRRARSAAVSSSRACVRAPRTSPTPWRRLLPSRRGRSSARCTGRGIERLGSVSLTEIEARAKSLVAAS